MQPDDALYGVIKNGVLTIGAGYGASIKVLRDRLVVRDGGVEQTFGRATCPISRIVVVRSEGFMTFPAVRWITDIGAALVMLHYDGTPLLVTVSRAPVPAAVRRVQASTTIERHLGRSIASTLIRAKIEGQAATLRALDQSVAALDVLAIVERMSPHASALDVLGAEGMSSALYWQALADRPLSFGRRQNEPEHWRAFGPRRSSITGDPRGATTPGNALLNYLYGVLGSEITIALHAAGLDPALGILHADKDERASLAYDFMEPARPILDRWFFAWLAEVTFSKRDFHEDLSGFIRVTHPLNSHLAMTAPLWRGMAEALVQWLFARLAGDAKAQLHLKPVDIEREASRRAKRWALGNSIQRPIPTTCMECGKALPSRRRKFCSDDCTRSYHGGGPAVGVAAMQRALIDARAKGDRRIRSTGGWTYRPRKHLAVSATEWRAQANWSKDRDAQMVEWFRNELAPRLGDVRPVDIQQATGLSASFVLFVRNGKRVPHPRWHRALADLTGVEYPFKDHNCGDKR